MLSQIWAREMDELKLCPGSGSLSLQAGIEAAVSIIMIDFSGYRAVNQYDSPSTRQSHVGHTTAVLRLATRSSP